MDVNTGQPDIEAVLEIEYEVETIDAAE